MKRWFVSLCSFGALILHAGAGNATVDGGITAELIGTARSGQWAIIAESSLQEECLHAECPVYVVDTTAASFQRLMMVALPPRWELLKKEHCDDLTPRKCTQVISTFLVEENKRARQNGTSEKTFLLDRYIDQLSLWQKAQLGDISPAPSPEPLTGKDEDAPGPRLVLSEIQAPRAAHTPADCGAKGPLTLRLSERWTAASFRSTSDDDNYCRPSTLPGCHQEERWEDGARTQAWACGDPSESQTKGTEQDCAGRASFVRVEASWGDGPVALGRSSWVEPGRLAQAAMGLVRDRTVDLDSLTIARHSVSVFALPHATLAVGGYAHGMFANGSWFPLVVAVPHDPAATD